MPQELKISWLSEWLSASQKMPSIHVLVLLMLMRNQQYIFEPVCPNVLLLLRNCHCIHMAPLFRTALFYIRDVSIQQPPIYMGHEYYWTFIFESCIFSAVTVAPLCSVYLLLARLTHWICSCFKHPLAVRRREFTVEEDGFWSKELSWTQNHGVVATESVSK